MSSTARKLKLNPEVENQHVQAWNRRVLVVEDEPAIAEAYRDILLPANTQVIPILRSSRSVRENKAAANEEMEFELTIVNNAEAALAEVKHALQEGRPFTMGFFDVLLGAGMDGIELVKQIHQLDPHLYAVFVTAYHDRNVDTIRGLLGHEKSNLWDYLNKPFTQGEIRQKARNGVTLWNLRADREAKDVQLSAIQKKLFDNERFASVAAVARGVGHEFGNILVQILGKAELNRDGSPEQMREALTTIVKASQHAAEILDRFKHLSNPKGVSREKKWIFLHQPLDEALDLMSHQLKTSQIKVTRIKSQKVPVFANSTSLLQVCVNLIINAIHAMGTSGQIDISVSEIESHGEQMGEIRVRDYGPGVDPSVLPKLTEAFFTTKGDKGTGLGLAISKEIIEIEHQGKMTLRNHEAKGLEVVLQIPLEPDELLSADEDAKE